MPKILSEKELDALRTIISYLSEEDLSEDIEVQNAYDTIKHI